MQPAVHRRLAVLSGHVRQHEEAGLLDSDLLAWPCRADEGPVTKVMSSEAAAELIKDGWMLTPSGFVGTSAPEAVLKAIRARFDATGHPRNLGLIFAASVGDSKGRGLGELAVEGLVGRLIYGWTGTAPGFLPLIRSGAVQAWNLPLGVVCHMLRDVAARRPGTLTTVGLGTFVDPRARGGRLNEATKQELVQLVELGGRQYLWYKAPDKVHAAVLRGTTADLDGNVSFEREALLGDQLNQAMAAHNSGGKVIVQVERLAARGSLPPRSVHLPGAIVDAVVLAPPELHWQTLREPEADGSLCGEVRTPLSALPALPLDARKVIAHRALLEVESPGCIVNLGVGMPEGVAVMAATHGSRHPPADSVVLTTEAGAWGGVPGGGLRFGTSHNAAALVPTATMMDFYQGRGVDLACLGMAEVDERGDVNVSSFGTGRMPGCGGFIDISQSSKRVLFLGTFTSGGLEVEVGSGQLRVVREGRVRKFRSAVHEVTFAGASGAGRPVLYITERAVFRLRCPPGEGPRLELVELAPGVDLERDVLAQMDFRPEVSPDLRPMPAVVFER